MQLVELCTRNKYFKGILMSEEPIKKLCVR